MRRRACRRDAAIELALTEEEFTDEINLLPAPAKKRSASESKSRRYPPDAYEISPFRLGEHPNVR